MTTYRTTSHALLELLDKALTVGTDIPSRNGDTKELLHQSFTIEHPDQPYLTTAGRRVSLPAQIAEVMWILSGRNDIEWLSRYLKRAPDFSDDGLTWRGGYGPRIRNWGAERSENGVGIDQLEHVVQLLRAHPDTRRAVIQIYDPAIDAADGKDIPCNNWLHFMIRDGELHLHVATRSNDIFWGWSGINSFEWSILQILVASMVGVKVGKTTYSVSSLHLYERHFRRAADLVARHHDPDAIMIFNTSEQAGPMPQRHQVENLDQLDAHIKRWFEIEERIWNDPWQNGVGSLINSHPERMMRSWLWVLHGWITDTMDSAMKPYRNSALVSAAFTSPKRAFDEVPPAPQISLKEAVEVVEHVQATEPKGTYLERLIALHREKNAVYGDSWKKRGEMFSIIPNMARKVDRLGVAGAGDTASDTAIDLCIYAAKYQTWLAEKHGFGGVYPSPGVFARAVTLNPISLSDDIGAVHAYLETIDEFMKASESSIESLTAGIKREFERLVALVDGKGAPLKISEQVDYVAHWAYRLGELLEKEEWKAANEKRAWKGYDQ